MGATKHLMGSPNHAFIMQCSSRCTCTLYYLSAGKFQMSNVVLDFEGTCYFKLRAETI